MPATRSLAVLSFSRLILATEPFMIVLTVNDLLFVSTLTRLASSESQQQRLELQDLWNGHESVEVMMLTLLEAGVNLPLMYRYSISFVISY